MARILQPVLRVRRKNVEFVVVSSVGIGSTLSLQQPNPLDYNLATGNVTNSPATSSLSFLNAPSAGPSDPASTSSATSGSSAPQAFDASLQAFLVQLQSALGNGGATGQSAPAGAANPLTPTSAQASLGVDADGDQDGSQAQAGQVTGHHHGHHHHKASSATGGTNGPANASTLQNDVNNLVSDLFSMLQQTGSSMGTGLTATTASASGSNSDPSSSATAVASSSSSTNTSDPTLAQTDPNSLVSIANTLSLDLLNAIQAYSSPNALQSIHCVGVFRNAAFRTILILNRHSAARAATCEMFTGSLRQWSRPHAAERF
jgi:hypothetical protein